MFSKSVLAAAIVTMSLGIAACGGSNTTVQQTETQGQQLMDLQEARGNDLFSP